MSGVDELNDGGRIVACEGLRAGRQEEWVVLPPYGQKRRFMRSKVLLEGRIERDVALVVTEEIQLNFIRSGSCEVEVVEGLAVRRDQRRIPHALRVLPARRLGAEEGSQRLAIRFGRVLPICTNWIPARTEPFLVGVPVLRNDRGDAIRMASGNAEARGRAIVEDVDGETIEAHDLRESIDDVGHVVERVREARSGRHIRLPKPRKIGSDDMKAIRQKWNQVPKHVARAREAVKQEKLRRIDRPRLAIEDLEPVDIARPMLACRPVRLTPQLATTLRAASRMMSTTAAGAVTLGVWSSALA